MVTRNEHTMSTECLRLLQHYARNVVEESDPRSKFRRISLGNPTFAHKIWSVADARTLLLDAGWVLEEDQMSLVLPPDHPEPQALLEKCSYLLGEDREAVLLLLESTSLTRSIIKGAGDGVFAARDMKRGEILADNLCSLPHSIRSSTIFEYNERLGCSNSSFVPDWKALLLQATTHQERIASWKEYLSASLLACNLRETYILDETMLTGEYNIVGIKDLYKDMTVEITQDITQGNELLRHYGFQWLPMKLLTLAILSKALETTATAPK